MNATSPWRRNGDDIVRLVPTGWRHQAFDCVPRRYRAGSAADERHIERLEAESPPYVRPRADPEDPTTFVLVPDLDDVDYDRADGTLPDGEDPPETAPGRGDAHCFLAINDHGNATLHVWRDGARALYPRHLLERHPFVPAAPDETGLLATEPYVFENLPELPICRSGPNRLRATAKAYTRLAALAGLYRNTGAVDEHIHPSSHPVTRHDLERLASDIEEAARQRDERPSTLHVNNGTARLGVDPRTLPRVRPGQMPPRGTRWWCERIAGEPCVVERCGAWTAAWAVV